MLLFRGGEGDGFGGRGVVTECLGEGGGDFSGYG